MYNIAIRQDDKVLLLATENRTYVRNLALLCQECGVGCLVTRTQEKAVKLQGVGDTPKATDKPKVKKEKKTDQGVA